MRPAAVGRAFATLGFRETYLADLDAIAGREPAWSVYAELRAAGLTLTLDAGPSSVDQVLAMAQFESQGQPIGSIVAGLESLPSIDMLGRLRAAAGTERFIFSLDLKAGRPLANAPSWQNLTPLQIAVIALRAGVRRIIVLDLASVGVGQGVPTAPLCRALRCLDPELEIIAGGGVRGPQDLSALEAAGCNAALVASALHDGRLSAQDCAARARRV
jgi:phosphoribosylformimino-5-aminoimidazole carboxamide ribotide isomerase